MSHDNELSQESSLFAESPYNALCLPGAEKSSEVVAISGLKAALTGKCII